MPLKLVPPRAGKTSFWYGRGSHIGIAVDRSTKATEKSIARRIVKGWEKQIEKGTYLPAAPMKGPQTFLSATVAYLQAGGDPRFVDPLLAHFGETELSAIDQDAIDAAAAKLYPSEEITPKELAPTRNRQVYTPISAILKRAGRKFEIQRPIGWRGRVVRQWLWPEQAWRVLEAAYDIEAELGVLCAVLLHGGLRIGEQLAMTCDGVRLDERFAWVPDSKNGEPQPIHLTPWMCEALRRHPRGVERRGERLFRFHKGGGLDFKLIQATALASGIERPKRAGRGSKWPKIPPYELDWVTWHTFRRTYATWMRRYGGLDDKDLVDTGRWKTVESASRYAQTVVREAAVKADLLPVPLPKNHPMICVNDVENSPLRGQVIDLSDASIPFTRERS